mmetsp:Transcript_105378/g.183271  ORF Transcript_105378/g.183271 Transcript_105378/m.183271 type:complete len:218 (-) Transcript_105378:120-773(-)
MVQRKGNSTKHGAAVQKKKTIHKGTLFQKKLPKGHANGLRALSVCCPEIAVAILGKQKSIENRSWPLPRTVVQPGGTWLALHVSVGSKGLPVPIRNYLQKAWDKSKAPWPWHKMDPFEKRTGANELLPKGSIVGFMRVIRSRKLRRGEKSENPWALGPYCWEIDRAVPLASPITGIDGNLGCWNVDKFLGPGQINRLRASLREAKGRRGFGCFKAKR